MKCRVEYRHPVTHVHYYFVDLCERNGQLLPVGHFSFRKDLSTIFESKRVALELVSYLKSLNYEAWVVRCNP